MYIFSLKAILKFRGAEWSCPD